MNFSREVVIIFFASGTGIWVWQALEQGHPWLWGAAASWALYTITLSIRAGKED